jgi:hypothetical protein
VLGFTGCHLQTSEKGARWHNPFIFRVAWRQRARTNPSAKSTSIPKKTSSLKPNSSFREAPLILSKTREIIEFHSAISFKSSLFNARQHFTAVAGGKLLFRKAFSLAEYSGEP